ncbi:hypothetical protein U4960_12645 [Altererythrobacter sp. H2]|uniref:hypothetical protein n=1 Tax=Altererythrobacter sp. H2 TaxID=3108391 RepID=UPI000BD603CC|nr:hypothetical protein [Altererythrobacter sp. H2]OZA94234.1 MAG: hypothetical protein B7X57_02260 [Erythrobacter sp. 34-65-8]WRK95132.1 hypothetical protein U4960_12645 [Altererythrobacter sp. H2]
MKTITKALAKGTLGTVAAGALAMTSATPALANDHRDGGISTGDVIAGAVIIGGIAAIAAAVGNRGDDRYRDGSYGYRDNYRDNYRGGDRWQARGNPRAAVERCVNAARQDARRAGYRYAQVTQIRDVDDTRNGWRVRGNVVVDGNRGWNGRDRYDSRWGYNNNRSDSGRFDCRIERGRVTYLDFSGIRGLR